MRPQKAIVISSFSPITESLVIENLIKDGICGRLALFPSENISESLSGENCQRFEDSSENSQLDLNLLASCASRIVYLYLRDLCKIEQAILYSKSNKWSISLILPELYHIPLITDPLLPRQSYQFENCEQIIEDLRFSVFYVNFEENYTRKDWIQGLPQRENIGANGIILARRHYIELLSRLGIKAKYGS